VKGNHNINKHCCVEQYSEFFLRLDLNSYIFNYQMHNGSHKSNIVSIYTLIEVNMKLIVMVFVSLIISTSFLYADVLTAQKILNSLGYNVGIADGIWGKNTENGIRDLYLDQGRQFDGIFDDEDLQFLEEFRSIEQVVSKTQKDIFTNFKFRKELPGNFKEYGYQTVSKTNGFPVRDGTKAIRIEVRNGDCGFEFDGSWSDCDNDRERHEVRSQGFSGQKYLYFSVFIPTDFQVLDGYANTSIAQIYADTKNKADPMAPVLMFKFSGGDRLKIENSVILPTVETVSIIDLSDMQGRWNDFLIYANWTDQDDGFIYIFRDGEASPIYKWKGATLQQGFNEANFKFGVYRSHISRSDAEVLPTQILLYDALTLSEKCIDEKLNFSCSNVMKSKTNDTSLSRTCNGQLCKPVFDRSIEGLQKRFECLVNHLEISSEDDIPSPVEIQNLISNLQKVKNTYYRNPRHLVKLGLSESVVDAHKKELLKLANDTGNVDAFCSKFN